MDKEVITFHRYLDLPRPVRRDVARVAMLCAKRTISEAEKIESVADDLPDTRTAAVIMAVAFIRCVESGIAEIVIERDGRVFMRSVPGLTLSLVH